MWLLVSLVVLSYAHALLPKWTPTYQMNLSTMIMPCNESGYYNENALQNLAKFGLISVDWSNAKALWANAAPMNCAETLLAQVTAIKSINPSAKTFVYRNLVKALPWFTDIREKILDSAYSGWFLNFKNDGPYHVPPCTNITINGKTTSKCSMIYHDREQTPSYPGLCHSICDCGSNPDLPCGEYLYDHRNESMRKWLTDTFILSSANNAGLLNKNIDGYFIDDQWYDHNAYGSNQCAGYNKFGGPTEEDQHCIQDMGLTADDVADITNGWNQSMAMAEDAIVSNNGFWWNNGASDPNTGLKSAHSPGKSQCIGFMRGQGMSLNETAMILEYTQTVNMTQIEFEIDLAFFLLLRGDYGWLGYNFNGCHSNWQYQWNEMLDKDYGKPVEPFNEVESGVFQRKWSKCVVQFDCNAYQPSFNFTQ